MRVPRSSASKRQYMKWLAGHLSNGGDIRYWRDRPFERRDMRVISSDFTFPKALCGANAVDFLVKPGVEVKGPRGHCMLYYLDDYTFDGSGPEMFSDIDMQELESMANLFS